MSHELRTPIVSIKTYTDMLLDGLYGELTPTQTEKLNRIKNNTQILINAIYDLLKKNNTKKLIFNYSKSHISILLAL